MPRHVPVLSRVKTHREDLVVPLVRRVTPAARELVAVCRTRVQTFRCAGHELICQT